MKSLLITFLFSLTLLMIPQSKISASGIEPFEVSYEDFKKFVKEIEQEILVIKQDGHCVRISYTKVEPYLPKFRDAEIETYNFYSDVSKYVAQKSKKTKVSPESLIEILKIFEEYEIFSLSESFQTPLTGISSSVLGDNWWLTIKWDLGKGKKELIRRKHKDDSETLKQFLATFEKTIAKIIPSKSISQQDGEADPIIHGNFANEHQH